MDGRDRGGVQARKSEIQRSTMGATRWQARRHEGRDGEGEKGASTRFPRASSRLGPCPSLSICPFSSRYERTDNYLASPLLCTTAKRYPQAPALAQEMTGRGQQRETD